MPVHSFSGMPSGRAGFAVNVGLKELTIYPLLHIIVCSNAGHRGRWLQCSLSLILEVDLAIRGLLANKPTLVNKVVMMSAKHYQVVQTRFAAIRPVLYVVSIDKSGVGTAWEAATFVSNA